MSIKDDALDALCKEFEKTSGLFPLHEENNSPDVSDVHRTKAVERDEQHAHQIFNAMVDPDAHKSRIELGSAAGAEDSAEAAQEKEKQKERAHNDLIFMALLRQQWSDEIYAWREEIRAHREKLDALEKLKTLLREGTLDSANAEHRQLMITAGIDPDIVEDALDDVLDMKEASTLRRIARLEEKITENREKIAKSVNNEYSQEEIISLQKESRVYNKESNYLTTELKGHAVEKFQEANTIFSEKKSAPEQIKEITTALTKAQEIENEQERLLREKEILDQIPNRIVKREIEQTEGFSQIFKDNYFDKLNNREIGLHSPAKPGQ